MQPSSDIKVHLRPTIILISCDDLISDPASVSTEMFCFVLKRSLSWWCHIREHAVCRLPAAEMFPLMWTVLPSVVSELFHPLQLDAAPATSEMVLIFLHIDPFTEAAISSCMVDNSNKAMTSKTHTCHFSGFISRSLLLHPGPTLF